METGSKMIALRPAITIDFEIVKYCDTKQHVIDSDPEENRDCEIELWINPEWWAPQNT
jgi:aminoglycoside 6'-N-acetyltransferase